MPDLADDTRLADGDLQLDPSSPQLLPAAFFPACWHSDDTRMSVLFAPFRSRSLNPLNYATKLQFWQQLIRSYCDHKGTAQCTIAELRSAFRRNGKQPYSLGTVLDEMLATGAARPAADFLAEPQHTWRGWAAQRMQAALAWPVQRVTAGASWWPTAAKSPQRSAQSATSGGGGEDQLQQQQQQLMAWICVEAVEAHARRLQANELVAGHVLSVEQLVALQRKAEGATAPLSADGVRLAVHQLRCEQKASVRWQRGVMLVRIAGSAEAGQQLQPAELPEAEASVWAVRESVGEQRAVLERLDAAEAEADRACRELVREGKKAMARVQLRKRKLLEDKIKKESDKLHNLETMLHSIEESQQSAAIIGAYQLAAKTLRQSHLDSGVTPETVGDIMADVQEVLDDHTEIELEMGNGVRLNGAIGASSSATDDAELEAELDELVQADRLEEEQHEREMNASIERRLQQLNIDGFGDLSVEEKNEILGNSVDAMRKARDEAKGSEAAEAH